MQEVAALNIFCSMLYFFIKSDTHKELKYRDADKFLARPGRKQANVSVRTAWISFGGLAFKEKKLYDSSRLDFVEIARVPDILSSFIPSWSS